MSKILKTLLFKSPKIALIIVILFAIALDRGSLFGSPMLSDTTSSRSCAMGYASEVPVSLSVDASGLITGVTLGKNSETRGYIEHVKRAGLLESWNGMTLEQAARHTPDAVSGATFSSRAIIANVNSEAAALSANPTAIVEHSPYTLRWILEQSAVLAVVLLALASYLWPARMKRFRLALLLLSIGVLGVWQGAFLSIQLLLGWVVNATTMMQVGLVLILALAVLIPLLFGRSYYCSYLCPFGALQELAAKVPVRKIPIKAKVVASFRWVKRSLLVAFVILLFVNKNFEPAEWEPFSVFMINSAAVSVVVIASLSVLASMFMPRAWCRLLCPTGEILLLLQREQKLGNRR